jgi:zinc transport system permease protein
MLTILSYPPILRGFLVLLLAGSMFPLAGVFVVRLNLITLRFMLMHGTLLGGAVALALGIDPLVLGVAVNAALILTVSRVHRQTGQNIGHIVTFFMVLTIGLAFAVIYKANVPAKDTLAILWGNLYALSNAEAIVTGIFAIGITTFVTVAFPRLRALLFDREIAFASGLNTDLLYNLILMVVGLTVAFAMNLIGALLLDALLILPAVLASFLARSTRVLFILSAAFGALSSVLGFALSVGIDIPASSGVTIVAALLLGAGAIIRRVRKRQPTATGITFNNHPRSVTR